MRCRHCGKPESKHFGGYQLCYGGKIPPHLRQTALANLTFEPAVPVSRHPTREEVNDDLHDQYRTGLDS